MMKTHSSQILCILCFCTFSFAQETKGQPSKAIQWADSIYGTFENSVVTAPAVALPLLDSALKIYAFAGDTCKMARIGSWRGNAFDASGRLDSAISVMQRALTLFRPGCDSLILMSIDVNLSNVYLSLGEFERVLGICNGAIAQWNQNWPYSIALNGLYTNRAIALANLGKTDAALAAFRDVLHNAQQEGILDNQIDACSNLGAMFGMMAEGGKQSAYLDSSEKYQIQAVILCRQMGLEDRMLLQFSNLAALAYDRERYQRSLSYLDSADALATKLKDLPNAVSIAFQRAKGLYRLKRYQEAMDIMYNYVNLKDSLLDIEKVKSIADMQEKYESEKKAGEIKELKIQNLDGQLKEEKVTRSRNIILFSGIGVLLIALGLWNRLLFTRKAKTEIEAQKQVSEELLLNILPEETARELKEKGHSDAQLIDQVTVVFTDFKGFTMMSEQLSPKELVKDLHECFSQFDHICEKYGIEKIKTIGDAYMAAGGLPTPNTTHAQDVVRAALEMAEVVEYGKEKKVEMGLPYFEIRIGVHTGPVVAGIVGVKKFQYDIWGDTVNTASRMESSGEVGKVNISESTYSLLKDDPQFAFTDRGELIAKGKGKLKMYFVQLIPSI